MERLVHNERVKLSATWFNSLSVACIIAGFVTMGIVMMSSEGREPFVIITFLFMQIALYSAGVCFRMVANYWLIRLR
ncbi:hypothetical protein EAH89_17410 [Roseomonas nepalensis]|uniref:Uncharacterized protein n=1 Tax=Muricoccus nepalensis TaxID=1854500 RepID=A0A502FUZ8_9PROT|nr:hypothetical protein EAH89_17410 [Roseomonas nepalensis]